MVSCSFHKWCAANTAAQAGPRDFHCLRLIRRNSIRVGVLSREGGDSMVRQKERRKDQRSDCMLFCPFEGEIFRRDGHIVNLSYGGAGIRGTQKLPAAGTELLVTIRHPWKTIKLKSKVVWVKSVIDVSVLADFGVEFMGTLYERQQQLANFFPPPDTLEA